jgi:hypothetical protein
LKRALAVTAGLLLGAGIVLVPGRQDGFPHAEHAGLFPTCVGCHAGVGAGDEARLVSVGPEDCAGCHDGTRLDRVAWMVPEPQATNLDFSHAEHIRDVREAGRDAIACEGCHVRPGVEERMQVVLASGRRCMECHAPGQSHLEVTIACSTCHLTLARATELSSEQIEAFPQPASHGADDFLRVHGEDAEADDARCAVCHARESCERCHLNAPAVPAVAALSPDARVAALVADRPGEWPRPASHERTDWAWAHGEEAERDIGDCASCHTRPSCQACHGTGLALATKLPEPGPEGRRGVVLADVEAAVHPVDFATRHGEAAAVGVPNCTACHTEEQCAACHDGAAPPRFHPVDFVLRHGADAFGSETECATCHSREAFCRDCHMTSGFAAGGRTGGAFHDAVPDWLLAHGQAARQELEACTACHDQSTCLRCHSAKSGLRINPHGPGFEADRVAARSQQLCGICHFSLPGEP